MESYYLQLSENPINLGTCLSHTLGYGTSIAGSRSWRDSRCRQRAYKGTITQSPHLLSVCISDHIFSFYRVFVLRITLAVYLE